MKPSQGTTFRVYFSTKITSISRQQLSLENMLNPTLLAHRVATTLLCVLHEQHAAETNRNDFHTWEYLRLMSCPRRRKRSRLVDLLLPSPDVLHGCSAFIHLIVPCVCVCVFPVAQMQGHMEYAAFSTYPKQGFFTLVDADVPGHVLWTRYLARNPQLAEQRPKSCRVKSDASCCHNYEAVCACVHRQVYSC